tara:strand:+ start:5057 stop:9787 length:4731 start_codon:yes stop_codon:yes gene_type:complete
MSNKNQQQMNQAQRNRFASLPSRTNDIKKQQQQAEQVEQSQMQQTPIPQTIILESNRLTSRQDDSLAENYNTNHRWTTEFSNGGIQIRKGDEIRINSAYISSIGVGDLIEWDIREDSASQDNKANWIFSYYGCNDHLNDKRSGYNIKEVLNSEGTKFGGNGRFNFDCDNSPCPLIRVTPKSTIGTPTAIFLGEMTGQRISWFQDPYLKCRFYGETFTIKNPVLDDHYEFILYPKFHLADAADNLEYATAIQVKKYTGNNVVGTIDPRTIMGIGQTLHFKSQPEPYITDPNTNFHDKNENDWVFTIQDFRVGHADTGGANVIIVDSLNDLTGQNFPMTETITNTAKVLIGNLPSICSSSETGAVYQHTPLSTIVWTGSTSDNYIEVGDKFKQYEFCGVSYDSIDHTQGNMCVQAIDTQTENKVLEVQVASSNQTESQSKIKLHMISLIEPTPANHRSDQQVIRFQFEVGSVEDLAMKASGGGANSLKVFTELIGTNCIVFDFYGGGSISGREIAVCFLYTQTTPTNYSNFDYDTTNNIIQLNNVRRNQNSETLLNVLSTGQPITFNTTINNSEDYYLIKTPNFFTDFTASFTHEESKQFRGETWDWTLQNTINLQKRIDYYGYIKDNNNELTATNLNTINNRILSHSQLQSNSFNFQNPVDYTMLNRPIKYAGYINNDSSNIEVKHYVQHELKIEENYSSPSDIATALTEQTHYVGNAINKNGVEVPNSANNGLIQNAYYIPVWSSAGDLTDSSATGDNLNVEDPATGKLKGILQPNSFLLRYKMKDSSVAHYSKVDEPTYADDGDYDIYFKTKNTYINKPIAYHDIDQGFLLTNGEPDGGALVNRQFSLTADLDQTMTSTLQNVNAGQVQGNLQFAKCYTAKSTATNPVINGFPIEYAPDSFLSQYCGSNNVSISWDDTNSRFKIDFLHQPAVSKFEPSSEGIVQEGGQLSTTIYYPAPVGNHGNLYKLPRTRVGGVNIENWSSQDFSNITTPQQVRNLCNLDSSVDLSTEWFITDTTLDTNKPTAQNNYSDIGNRFWNKLGFLNSQVYKNVVGSSYDSNSNRYIPNGTTDNLIDIADALITAEEPSENTPFFFINEKFDGSKVEPATNQFGSIGGLNFNSHLSGYGIPNTTGVPISFISNELLSNLNIMIVNPKGPNHKKEYGDSVVSRPPFSEYLSTYNPDRERNTGYSFTTEPKSMTAQSLPIKTEFPYFYVMSDIIETDFNISVNKGTGLNCLGVMSKLNAEGDFFFQYQAPQSFFATKDKLISSITTELRTPTLGIPQALSPYSSVIYQISRYTPTPIKTSLPVWAEQKMIFDQMKDLLQNIATSLAPAIPITADQQIGDSMGGQVQGDFPDAPLQINTADQRDIYQSMINSISGRITEPLPAVQQALPGLRGIQNPFQVSDDPIPELTEEQQLEYELAVHAIRGRTRPNTAPPNLTPFPIDLGGLRNTNRNTLEQLVNNEPLNRIVVGSQTESVGGSLGSVDSLETIIPDPVRTQDKPDEDIPSMLGDSVAQSSVPPSYRGRSIPSYTTGTISVPPSQAPTYTSALTEVSEETIAERIQDQRRKEDDEMD